MKIKVDFYADGFKSGVIDIPENIAVALKGDKRCERKGFNPRDDRYWDAVRNIKGILASALGINGWEKSYMERTERGDTKAPINIISFSKI